MAATAARATRFRDAFTIRRRLIAFGIIASIFAMGASWHSFNSLHVSGTAASRAADLASVQHYHQDAMNQLADVRGSVLEAVLVGQGSMARSPDELTASLEQSGEAFRLDHEIITDLEQNGELLADHSDNLVDADLYLREALRLGDLAITDPDAALTQLDSFLAAGDTLFAGLEEVSTTAATATAQSALDAREAESAAERAIILSSTVGTGLIILLAAVVALSISRQLRELSRIARAMAAGDLQVRNEINSADELGGLARSFDEMADSFEGLVVRLEEEAEQDAFRRRLFDAFDMASDTDDVHSIVAEAMILIGDSPMELLLSDSSKHHVSQSVVHPDLGAPGCPVGSTGQCVAVRRGHRLVFESSGAIDACPHLKRRGTPCSAVCVPVTFNGQALGVIHSTGIDGEIADVHTVDRLAALASQTGARLGTINAFQGAREQATIDGLTGLRNRRTLENEVRALATSGTDYSLIMCDLDHFKALNDHYGHEVGDRALRQFGQVLRECTREGDIAARLGGEEFVIVQPGMTASEAIATVERIQLSLAGRIEVGDGPRFTSSFGLSDTSMATEFDSVLRIADAGLLAAKDQGRDRWVMGDLGMASELARRGRPRGTAPELVDPGHGPTILPDRI